MKRKWMIWVFVLFCLAGCGKKERTVEEPVKETAVIFTRGQGFSNDGITFLANSIVQYTDFATGETMPLCSRPNCPHRLLTSDEIENGTEPCMAYVANAYEAVVYKEKLYVFTDENGIRIYVSEADGSNRKLLAELANAFQTGTFSTFFSGSNIVVVTAERGVSKTEEGTMDIKNLRRLYCVDYETGKAVLTDHAWEHTIQLCGMDGDMAYVYEDYTLPEVYERYTEAELDKDPDLYRPYKRCELWQCSLKDGTTTQLLTGKLGADYSVTKVDKEGAVLAVHKQNEEEKYIYYSFATGEEKEIPLPRNSKVLQMESGSILFTGIVQEEEERESIIYRYFCNNGKVDKNTIDSSLVPIRMLGGKLYCLKDEMTVVLSLKDVLEGKSEACYQMNRTIYDIMK